MEDRMNIDMHGKKIKEVWWSNNEAEQGCHIVSDNLKTIWLSFTHHGDHDEIWIVETRVLTGDMIAHHNPKFVESIIWE